MKPLNFYIVDVFAINRYTGNPLAVFPHAAEVSDETMQAIAHEINYSETTFITATEQRNGGYDVRIFTPKKELPFAGHPTLGTAYIIQHTLIKSYIDTVKLNLQVGQIPVTWQASETEGETLWMRQNAPTFHQILGRSEVASVFSLEPEAIDDRFPIQEVSTGIPFIIVPLNHYQALQQIRVDRERYFSVVKTTNAQGILVFCPETHAPENDLSVRVFAESLGIPEDPATGSANGCLAGYLVQYAYFGHPVVKVRVEQGYQMGRPSQLFLNGRKHQDSIEVDVGGKVVMIAKGEFI